VGTKRTAGGKKKNAGLRGRNIEVYWGPLSTQMTLVQRALVSALGFGQRGLAPKGGEGRPGGLPAHGKTVQLREKLPAGSATRQGI